MPVDRSPHVLRLSRGLPGDPVGAALLLAGPVPLDRWSAVTWEADGAGRTLLRFASGAVPRQWRSRSPGCELTILAPERTPVAHRLRFSLRGTGEPLTAVTADGALMVSRDTAVGEQAAASRVDLVLAVQGGDDRVRSWLHGTCQNFLDTLAGLSLESQRV